MISCEVNGRRVEPSRIFTHWTGWKKPGGNPCFPYRIAVTFAEVIHVFENYWDDIVSWETDPDLDDGTPLVSLGAQLRDARYPGLAEMLKTHGNLFSRYILCNYQSEFAGFLVGGDDGPHPFDNFDYFIVSLEGLVVGDETVVIEGSAIEWKR